MDSTPEKGLSPKLLKASYRNQVVEKLRREGRLPTLEQWLQAVAKARQKYGKAIREARAQGPDGTEDVE
jgi:hypothetical protein